MKVAYLVNQYPKVSHSFIRREIAAVERRGVQVDRYSIRPTRETLVDPDDQAERLRTVALLSSSLAGLLAALLAAAIRTPLRWLSALRLATRMGLRSEAGVLRHWAYLAEACVLVRRMRAAGVRHLHAHFGTNSAAVALLARRLGGPPYSFTIHGPEEFDHPEALSLGDKVEHAAFVSAVSDYGRSQVLRWCRHHNWPKVKVIRCGVDGRFLSAAPEPVPAERRLVCVGRLCEQKGQLVLLEALAQLARNGIAFEMIFAGDGPMRPEIEAEVARLGLERHVRITGWLSNDEVRQYLRSCRLMVLPSLAEGLPVVLMEALALGRPVISTMIAGIPELVRDGVCGWLVPAGSPAALAAAIRAALSTPSEELSRMGAAGAALVAQRHDAAIEAARLTALFGVSASSPSVPAPGGSVSEPAPGEVSKAN